MAKELTSPELEEQLLSAALQRPELIDRGLIVADQFTDRLMSELAKLVLAMRFEGEQISAENVFVHGKREDLKVKFMQLTSRGLPRSSIEKAAKQLSDLSSARAMAAACSKFHERCYAEADDDIDQMLSDFEAEALAIRGGMVSEPKSGSDIERLAKNIEWRASNPCEVEGLRWGMAGLEKMMNGLYPGLHLVAARPSVGKTALMTSMILGLLERIHQPLVFSLEQSADQIQERVVAARTGVPTKIFTERPYDDNELKKIHEGLVWLGRQKWLIQDNKMIDCSEVISQIRRMHNLGRCQVVFLDYIQILRYKKFRKEGKRIEVGEISGALKRLADDLGIPIVALAQLKRKENYYDRKLQKSVSQPPELEDLKEAGELEQDADSVTLLERDQKNNAEDAKAILAKNRNGATGEVWLDYLPSITKFSESK